MNKKYLLYSFIYIASLSIHSFADHHDHFSFEDEHLAECQACEENVEIKIASTKNKSDCSQEYKKKYNFFGFWDIINFVRLPVPGPTSNTSSFELIFETLIILFIIFLSCKKF